MLIINVSKYSFFTVKHFLKKQTKKKPLVHKFELIQKLNSEEVMLKVNLVYNSKNGAQSNYDYIV